MGTTSVRKLVCVNNDEAEGHSNAFMLLLWISCIYLLDQLEPQRQPQKTQNPMYFSVLRSQISDGAEDLNCG
jgi:hypothetical protein